MRFSFADYLRAKVVVDDAALNRVVFQAACEQRPAHEPLRVLELGAGLGAMLMRLVRWGFLPPQVHYDAVDANPDLASLALAELRAWARKQGGALRSQPAGATLHLPRQRIRLHWHTAEVHAFLRAAADAAAWDVVLAHAFMDLVDPDTLLPALFRRAPAALLYFTLVFDGGTHFEPVMDRAWEDFLMTRYHCTMDLRRTATGEPAGSSRAGRELLRALPAHGAQVLAAGASDWVVYPRGGKYTAAERVFLHFIVHTVHQALRADPEVPPARLEAWVRQRHRQVEDGQLVYIAHQLDVLARAPGARPGDHG